MSRFRTYTLLMTVLLLLVIVVLAWQLRGPFNEYFPLLSLRVEGPLQQVTARSVRDVVVPYTEGGFFAADLAAIRQAVLAMPWVRQVSVQRLWPDTLRLVITEQRAVARWRDQALVNEVGELFTPSTLASAELARLPYLDMAVENGHVDVRILSGMEQILKVNNGQLASLKQDRRGSLRLLLKGDFELYLGHEQPLARLARFFRFFPRLSALTEGGFSIVDLRYKNGLAVRRKMPAHG